jgi:hypothetical protein
LRSGSRREPARPLAVLAHDAPVYVTRANMISPFQNCARRRLTRAGYEVRLLPRSYRRFGLPAHIPEIPEEADQEADHVAAYWETRPVWLASHKPRRSRFFGPGRGRFLRRSGRFDSNTWPARDAESRYLQMLAAWFSTPSGTAACGSDFQERPVERDSMTAIYVCPLPGWPKRLRSRAPAMW